MGYLGQTAILAIVAAATCSCAASYSTSPPRAQPPLTRTDPGTTELTSAVALVPAATPPPSPIAITAPAVRWTDAQIVAAVGAALEGRGEEAKLARARSQTARAERLAKDLMGEDREMARDFSALTSHVSSEPSELRAKVMEARNAAGESLRSSTSLDFDRGFVDGELRYEQTLLHLLDEEMIPSATSPDLRSYLQTLRARTQTALTAAEQVDQHLH